MESKFYYNVLFVVKVFLSAATGADVANPVVPPKPEVQNPN